MNLRKNILYFPILPLKYFVLLPRCQVYPACILINFPETENIVHVAFCEFDLLKIETRAEDTSSQTD